MSKKHTTLRSAAITGHKSLSSTTSTIDITSNHDVTTVGQPTAQTPNIFSIVDMTEKVVDLDIVDNTLLLSQRNTDIILLLIVQTHTVMPKKPNRNRELQRSAIAGQCIYA